MLFSMLSKWELFAIGVAITLLLVGIPCFLIRILEILPSGSKRNNRSFTKSLPKRSKTGPSHMVVVLGSGGHTAEMVDLLRDIDPRRYLHRTYIISSGDNFSSEKAAEIEDVIQSKYSKGSPTREGEMSDLTGTWDIEVVPRARKIHQPLITTPLSCLWCLVGCLRALYRASRKSKVHPGEYPDVIVANGPATAIIVAIAATTLRFFAIAQLRSMKIVYVESFARVRTLSLSGRILLRFGVCDAFIVQWEGLAKNLNRTASRRKVEWKGFLVGGPCPPV